MKAILCKTGSSVKHEVREGGQVLFVIFITRWQVLYEVYKH